MPSGKSIAVVRFIDEKPAPTGLQVCPACHSELVQPVSWSEAEGHRWELTLECPNCAWTHDGLYDRDQVDQLEEKLDDGLVEMLGDLHRLTQSNMADEIDRFIFALRANQILPEDF